MRIFRSFVAFAWALLHHICHHFLCFVTSTGIICWQKEKTLFFVQATAMNDHNLEQTDRAVRGPKGQGPVKTIDTTKNSKSEKSHRGFRKQMTFPGRFWVRGQHFGRDTFVDLAKIVLKPQSIEGKDSKLIHLWRGSRSWISCSKNFVEVLPQRELQFSPQMFLLHGLLTSWTSSEVDHQNVPSPKM